MGMRFFGSTPLNGGARREIAHNAPPPVGFFYTKWNSNTIKKGKKWE